MTSLSLSYPINTSWDKVCSKVKKAIVFVDSATSESLHWNGGLMRMLDAGALDVKELSSFEMAPVSCPKGVFIVSTTLDGVTLEIIKDIIQASKFQYVIVITSVSPHMHLYSKTHSLEGDTQHIFDNLKDEILEWTGNMNYTVEVLYIPCAYIGVTEELFLLPASEEVFPLVSSSLPAVKRRAKGDIHTLADIDLTHLSQSVHNEMKAMVSSIDALLGGLSIKEECYSIGHTSRILATKLANYSQAKTRRKHAANKASLIFIDRTLDLYSVLGSQDDCLLDKILKILPRLPQHNNDVMVDMADVCSSPRNQSQTTVCPGCLYHYRDKESEKLFKILMLSRQKESLMEVQRHLIEAVSKENLPLKLTGKPGRVTPEQLLTHVKAFKGKTESICHQSGLLQLVLAVIQTLDSKRYTSLENLAKLEKVIIQSQSDDSSRTPLQQLLEIIDGCKSFNETIQLVIATYSLCYTSAISISDEEHILDVLVEVFDSSEADLDEELEKILLNGVPVSNKVAIRERLGLLLTNLNSLAEQREDLKHFKSILFPSNIERPASYVPFVKQAIELILDPRKDDQGDIEHRTSGLKDLLKSGFGLFGMNVKPKPGDCPLVVIFMVGGITMSEVKIIHDAAVKARKQVLVGSTSLVRAENILHKILSPRM